MSSLSPPLLLVVAALFVDSENRVLLAQRPAHKALGGLWEFPGGKIEAGESPEQALVRELQEELGVAVEPRALEPFTFASHAYESFHLLMPLYIVRSWRGEPKPLHAQALAWVRPEELRTYKMPPADEPLIERIIEKLAR